MFHVSSCLQVQKLVGRLEPWNFISFHSLGNVMIPTDDSSIIFQRGRRKTHQPVEIHHHSPSLTIIKSPLITINHQPVTSSYKFQIWPGRSTGHPLSVWRHGRHRFLLYSRKMPPKTMSLSNAIELSISPYIHFSIHLSVDLSIYIYIICIHIMILG